MKTLLCFLLLLIPLHAADANPTARHEQFYASYRAQKARYEKAIADLQTEKAKEDLLWQKKFESGVRTQPIKARSQQLGERIGALKKEFSKLDVARLEYEKKNPGAEAFAGVAPVATQSELFNGRGRGPVPVVIVNRPDPVRVIITNPTNAPAR